MTSITPYITQVKAPGELQDLAVELYKLDAILNAKLPDALREPMIYLLRVINSFYSNKIEGNPTHPAEILHVQEEGKQSIPSDDLLEIKQYVEVQTRLANSAVSPEVVCTPAFLQNIHQSFYDNLPKKFLEIENPESGEMIRLTPVNLEIAVSRLGDLFLQNLKNLYDYLAGLSVFTSQTKFMEQSEFLPPQPLIID